jgi:Uma2 family endonuclease
MAARHQRPATYDDIVRLPENMVGEIIDGDLYAWPRPSGPHGDALSTLGMFIGPPYRLGRGGPGGWWIFDEPELHLGRHVVVPDLGGWRRERMPHYPKDHVFDISPDWVCEILSPSTARIDRTRKMRIYAENAVAYYWIMDPMQRTLETFQLVNAQWVLLQTYAGDDVVHAEPFPQAEIELKLIWGETPDDSSPLPAP